MMKNKVRLLIVTNFLGIGGAERTVQTLALRVNKEAFDVTVLCLEQGGPRAELLERHGIRLLIGDGTIERIKTLVPHPDIDVMHIHRSGEYAPLHTAAVAYLRPKKIMETNIFAFDDPSITFDLHVYKSMMMLSQRVWRGQAQSPEIALRHRVIYNPVTVDYFDQFRLSSDTRHALRTSLGVSPDTVLLGRVGRDDPAKWGDLLFAALPALFVRHPQVSIVFRTVPSSRLKWLRKNRFFDGRVIVLPESSSEKEIAETYQMLDIYVHPSRRGEAFGNSLNEAMVWSLPIIVENTPHWDNGQLEQVEHGRSGWVVNSVGGLMAAIADLVNDEDKRKRFGQAGREKVAQEFDVIRGVAQYELAYRQLAGLDTSQVFDQMFPSAASLLSYHTHYQALAQIDMEHSPSPWLELRRRMFYWRWRVVDSLIARGFLSKPPGISDSI